MCPAPCACWPSTWSALRDALGAPIHLAVNGGYRSPAHKLAVGASPHMWGTAADIYQIGNVLVRDQATIETYNRIVDDVSDDCG